MQSANAGQSDDLRRAGRSLGDGSAVWRVLCESQGSAVLVMVGDVLLDQPNGMTLAEHDDVIQQLSPTAADPALRDRILPGAPECRAGWLRPHHLHEGDHGGARQIALPFDPNERPNREALDWHARVTFRTPDAPPVVFPVAIVYAWHRTQQVTDEFCLPEYLDGTGGR